MKKIIFLILLVVLGVYLFNSYNPFNIKIFNEEDSYKKEIEVEDKKDIKKSITAKDYFLQGKTNLKSNNLKMAILNFSKAIELNPNYVEAYKERALARDKNGDFNGSEQDYEKYMSLSEQQNKGKDKTTQKELKDALIEVNKKTINKKYDDAIIDLSNIINSYSKYPDGYIARADIYFKLQKYEQALKDYNKALSLGGENLSLYLKTAETNYFLGDYKNSIKYYKIVLNLYPNYDYAYYKLMSSYIFIEEFNNALNCLNTYISISSTKNAKINDYNKWTGILNKYTENETIRELKNKLKDLKLIK